MLLRLLDVEVGKVFREKLDVSRAPNSRAHIS